MADIVVGADGANSKVRPLITDIRPFYTGVTAVEGNVYDSATTVPGIHQLLKGGKIFAFGGGKDVLISSKGDGSLSFYASFRAGENWSNDCRMDLADKTQVLSWFKKEFSDWSDVWHELFENAVTPFFPRPIYCMPLDQSWEALPNLTMLGDAAHLMPPFAGEGVNMAMLDALELSECWDFNDIQTSIAVYEDQMRKRAAVAAEGSLENTEWMHSENALTMMLEMFNGKSST